jgi:hypothetical protein
MVRIADSPQHPIKRNWYYPADVHAHLAKMITDTLAAISSSSTTALVIDSVLVTVSRDDACRGCARFVALNANGAAIVRQTSRQP